MPTSNPAACLRKIADRLEPGDAADEWGPILFLLARSMIRTAPRKPKRD